MHIDINKQICIGTHIQHKPWLNSIPIDSGFHLLDFNLYLKLFVDITHTSVEGTPSTEVVGAFSSQISTIFNKQAVQAWFGECLPPI